MKYNMRLIGQFTESEGLSDDIPKRRLRKRRTANSFGAASQLPENIFMFSGSQDFPRNQPLLLTVEDEVDFSNQPEQR
ncbi:unnamed protein product, partial [Allacma fusca]